MNYHALTSRSFSRLEKTVLKAQGGESGARERGMIRATLCHCSFPSAENAKRCSDSGVLGKKAWGQECVRARAPTGTECQCFGQLAASQTLFFP